MQEFKRINENIIKLIYYINPLKRILLISLLILTGTIGLIFILEVGAYFFILIIIAFISLFIGNRSFITTIDNSNNLITIEKKRILNSKLFEKTISIDFDKINTIIFEHNTGKYQDMFPVILDSLQYGKINLVGQIMDIENSREKAFNIIKEVIGDKIIMKYED